jgi:hypothetical protein
MEFKDFRASLVDNEEPPSGLGPPLLALWYDAKGNWDKAHEVVQDDESTDSAWVHAYLHRKEGDLGNARYWYRRAGKEASDLPTDREWAAIVSRLVSQ